MITEELKNNLAREMGVEALGKYSLPYNDAALEKMVDTWYENKGKLINLLSNHPCWNPEKFQIVFDTNVDREINPTAPASFFNWVYTVLPADTAWTDTLAALSHHSQKMIDERIASYAKKDYPELKIAVGQKTSRATNKILRSLGCEGRDYEQKYAIYADALSPLQIKRHTILSVNPVDYLLMSNGNSWTSCHTINKLRSGDGYNGCRTSGTLSYMLDAVSMVYYQVDESYDGEDYELEEKTVRQMFHYEDGVLIQGRLYPQCNDGKNSLYVPIRATLQKILAECLNVPNLWLKKGGTSACSMFTCSTGTHYQDYLYQNECNVSRLVEFLPEADDERFVEIGHNPICPICGEEHNRCDWLYCFSCGNHTGDGNGEASGYYCQECGEWVDEDDVTWVGDDPYCRDCVTFCDHCNEWYLNSETEYLGNLDIDVCDECRNRYYTYCDCGHWERNDNVEHDARGNSYCDECKEALVEVDGELYHKDEVKICPICGKYHTEEGDLCEECEEEAGDER